MSKKLVKTAITISTAQVKSQKKTKMRAITRVIKNKANDYLPNLHCNVKDKMILLSACSIYTVDIKLRFPLYCQLFTIIIQAKTEYFPLLIRLCKENLSPS